MKSHHVDLSLAKDVPALARPGQSPALRDQPDEARAAARMLPVLRGSAEPQPSTLHVDTSAEVARDRQTGASVAQVLATVVKPPTRNPVAIESSGGPPYLHHGKK